ncbi:MAG TPA: chemotaxis protein CheW [Clostridiales bacterium]|nr:chemotaxis protein CheW [Clostridiales bacterium]
MAEFTDVISESGEDTQTGRFLTFVLGDETYGIQIGCVTEIVGMQAITEIPEMPDYIKGLINLRGIIIPLLDLRLRFGKPSRPYDDRTCIIVIDFNGMPVGLIVDSVSEVLTIPSEDIVALPALGSGLKNGYVRSIGKLGGCVVLLLDCAQLLSSDDVGSLNAL